MATADDRLDLVVMDHFGSDPAAAGQEPPTHVRLFASYAGARITVPMRLRSAPGEAPTRFGTIIATHERIKKYTSRIGGTLPDEARLLTFGSALFDTLFPGDVRRLYDEARSRQHGRRLGLVFTSMVPWIAEKPWEFAYDRSRQSFLATEDVHFVRNVLTGIPADDPPPQRGPLRILVASAQPVGWGRLSIDEETAVIRRGFEKLVAAGLATIEVLPRATPGAIHARIGAGDFSIVHFIGHGVFDDASQSGALVFEDEHGGQHLLGERPAREIFCQRGIRLVFLNACQTGTGGRADFNKGIAQSLVAHGLPALVANQYSVLDGSATQFAQRFYQALAQGLGIAAAAREARVAVNYLLQGELIDWAVPVVYARNPSMQVCAPTAASIGGAAGRRSTPPRRTRGARTLEVAVWDIDGGLPELDAALRTLADAQAAIGFRRAEISAPLDAWDLQNHSVDRTPYLWAERLAHRLARMPLELGVDLLVCITRHWLRDDGYLDIDAWWAAEAQPAVAIFSCAGFDELPEDGAAADRMVRNLLLAAIGGRLAAIDLHAGTGRCPMTQTARRSLPRLTGRQAFDTPCRSALQGRLPHLGAALRALEAAFD